ncbi:MAG: T9SS type A sorting domain-containing protein [Ignavibacteria bacterium]|nr:T9SS type A sorting domain-containing protein [Ignavibacteria bacterium]
MKKINVKSLFVLTIISFFNLNAQNLLKVPAYQMTELQSVESFPVNAHSYIEKFNRANGIDLNKFGPPMPSLQKSAWNFTVGSTRSWFASNFENNQFYSVPSTCRAVGTNCYIFVEDALWTNGRVDQPAVDAVRNAFDNSTPANASKGIYQIDVETFGNPPNVDNDNKIIILILNIKDGYTGPGRYVAGYFYGYNQYQQVNSNVAEIYYLDGDPLDFKKPTGNASLQTGLATTAHEFQHMIHFNYFGGNADYTFFNESWSLAAEVVCGYSLYSPSEYANEPNQYLFEWRSSDNTLVLNDYSRAARFSLYLKEQFGIQIFKRYHENKLKNENGINFALSSLGLSATFPGFLEDWYVANYFNDYAHNPKYGYQYSGLPKMTSVLYSNPNVSVTQDGVFKYGAKYITYKGGKNLSITFNNQGNTGIKVKAMKIGTASKQVVDVPTNSVFNVPDYGTTYSEVTFAIYHLDQNESIKGPHAFSYTSSGQFVNTVTELAYDSKEPSGIFSWSVGDSVAVIFEGMPGAKLDSIRVALRNLSSLNGSILRYSSTKMTGKTLAAPITATGKVYPSVPYPVPWTNWVKVDLRDRNIDASTSFVAAFGIDGVYQVNVSTGPNRVMHTYQPVSNSRTLTTNNGTRGWWNFYVNQTTARDSFVVYLIRAYVSFGPSDAKETVELLPSAFNLNQNFPNPFNPETVISFTLPKAVDVEIKIFDALGSEVRTLINENRTAGKHNIYWNATDNFGNRVSSGVYFYTIRADNFVETKKMVLMK